MHPFTLVVIAISVLVAVGLLYTRRLWRDKESDINDEFEWRLRRYQQEFGETESGKSFLSDIGAAAKVRLSDPSAVALNAAASTGVWTKVLGGSAGSSIGAGLFAAAVGFVAEAISKVRANRNKTDVQIAAEQDIARLLKAYVDGKQSSTNRMALITIPWTLLMVTYIGWQSLR